MRDFSSQPVDVDTFNASNRGEAYGDAPGMTAYGFAQHVERNAIDLGRSPRWSLDGAVSGIALLGFRGDRAWLGGFGVVPEFRGRGLGSRYLRDVFSICGDAGAQTLELEVLHSNGPAIALYKRAGFAIVDELVVWSRACDGSDRAPSARGASRRCGARDIAHLTRMPPACWQREPQSIAAASPCESLVIGDDAAPKAYALIHRNADRTTLLDVGARDRLSAELLLDALDAVAPEAVLRLINEPAHGPMHQAFTARAAWAETTRQHRMRRLFIKTENTDTLALTPPTALGSRITA